MTQRQLHLACYDVACPKRLARALKLTRTYATGGQRSVHEVFLTETERDTMVRNMRELLDLSADRFLLLRLDPRSPVRTLGKATAPAERSIFLVT